MLLRTQATVFYFIVLVVNIGVTVYFFMNPPIHVLHVTDSIFLEIWPSLAVKEARWLIFFGLVALSCLFLLLFLIQKRNFQLPDKQPLSWIINLTAPLGFLPLACLPRLTADHLSAFLGTNIPILVILVLCTIILTRVASFLLETKQGGRHHALWAVGIFCVFSVFHALGGFHISTHAGEHVGDEGHYLIQAQSLHEDRDLDIRNNIYHLLNTTPDHALSRAALHLEDGENPSLFLHPGWKGRFHVAANSRGEAWYSWHPYGLPLLLAPVWPWGLGARHAVLGVISGAGLAGLFLLCRQVGAGNVASALTVLSLGTSVYWSGYAFRALPELLGGTLLIWSFWGIAAQRQRPGTSLFVVAACCSYLPIAHVRFLPMSLMAMGLYGLFVLMGSDHPRDKLTRLPVFALLCATGLGIYAYLQFSMFSGGSHTGIDGILFTYPLGAWGILASDRGIIALLPVFIWIAGAMVVWLVVDRSNRLLCLGLLSVFLACLIVNTTNHMYSGGKSMPGRYIVCVVPLLFVGAALMLERSEIIGRSLFIFLSLFSTMLLFLTLYNVEYMRSGFFMPIHQLYSFPHFQMLYFPHAVLHRFFSLEFILTTLYCISGFAVIFYILFYRPRKWLYSPLLFMIVMLIGVYAMKSRHNVSMPRPNPHAYLHILPVTEAKHLSLNDPYSKRPPWELSFQIDRLFAHTGTRISGDEPGDKPALSALQEHHNEGMLAFGGYQYVFPGSYSAIFDVRLRGETDQSIATLDVALDRGMRVLAKSDTVGGSFAGLIALDFEARGFWLVEPRVFYNGAGDIDLLGITIRERIPDGSGALPGLELARLPMDKVKQVFPAYLQQIQESWIFSSQEGDGSEQVDS